MPRVSRLLKVESSQHIPYLNPVADVYIDLGITLISSRPGFSHEIDCVPYPYRAQDAVTGHITTVDEVRSCIFPLGFCGGCFRQQAGGVP